MQMPARKFQRPVAAKMVGRRGLAEVDEERAYPSGKMPPTPIFDGVTSKAVNAYRIYQNKVVVWRRVVRELLLEGEAALHLIGALSVDAATDFEPILEADPSLSSSRGSTAPAVPIG